jgi:hypothetical protein
MRSSLLGAALVSALFAARAFGTTCTITDAHVLVPSQEESQGFPLQGLAGLAIPVQITESSGAFVMDLSGLPSAPFIIQGVNNAIQLGMAGVVTGTIDAAGNVALPPSQVGFTTDFALGQQLSAIDTFTTGITAVQLSNMEPPTEGTPLDFGTGALHLEGEGIVHHAPVVGDAISGLSLNCTLAPVPSKANLPKAPALAKAHGVGKPGDATTGDTLTLQAKFTNGAASFDPAMNDVFVRVTTGSNEVVLLRVPSGSLAAKGKKLAASDADGSVLHLLVGGKVSGNGTVPHSGSLTLKQSKKGFALTLKETGLDLSPLGASGVTSATVTVGVGPVTASDDAKVKTTPKKLTLK